MSYHRTGDVEHHAGSLSPGVGIIGLGALDYGGVYSAQKNQARRTFGSTGVNMPGRTDIQWPNLSGRAAIDVLAYWRKEWERVYFQGRWPTAIEESYGRAGRVLKAKEGIFVPVLLTMQDKIIPKALAVEIWKTVDQIALASGPLATSPSPWSIAWDSVKEAAKEAPGVIADVLRRGARAATGAVGGLFAPINTLVKWSAIGLLAYFGVKYLQRPQRAPQRRR